MKDKQERTSAENTTKGNTEDEHERGLHPIKGTVKKGYKDKDSNKDRLGGIDKEELEKQVHSATDNSNKRVADKIQIS